MSATQIIVNTNFLQLCRRFAVIVILVVILLSYLRVEFFSFGQDGQYQAMVFLKTHKTGGSTIVTILQRYGERHRLQIALPKKTFGELRYNYFGDVGETLSDNHIYNPYGNFTFDILCNHVIYNRAAFKKIFKTRTFYFTILREPVSNFLSALNYYGLTDGYIRKLLMENTSNPIANFLKNPRVYEPMNVYHSFTDNRQLFDLGFSPEASPRDPESVRRFIKSIEEDFHFVMILEYFDESLILLKRLMGWGFKDILYIPQNKRRQTLVSNLTENDKLYFYKWNSGDLMLYKHFLGNITNRIRTQGRGLEREVSTFRRILQKVLNFCNLDEQVLPLTVEKTPWDEGFVYPYKECLLLRLNELQYLERLFDIVIK
ncbi:galactose-3-O-sulfotransferase 3-like isoform X1 [Ostrea edulis]|uniref:galactose-3-O-sulfotransferase 3-like isoform X1 n=1 Tax=Ostrea edulis TaxID=37623 RepID=UPI0024AEBDD7|nr:galactose-3-O-sulfotransferase 3-like isoform X1 [Ostrea edulis]XP_056000662.1 galactose-3-O-sulfotransferase 3-like isoform X1 [Ostrea edulis]XP_056000663.1 galactose-3-O-sulfotransferase 3-like isoform X1 [Ostrea edulis]XP_056000665.1 galactose-3-O-sulfotransferase 3-like isoform X1 [Ostrea edulis]